MKTLKEHMSEASLTGPEKIFIKNTEAALKNLRLVDKQLKVAIKRLDEVNDYGSVLTIERLGEYSQKVSKSVTEINEMLRID